MSSFEGLIRKMETEEGNPIRYYLNFENDFLEVNQILGKNISIQPIKTICVITGEETELYRMGVSKKVFFEHPAFGDWVIRPELSKAHEGEEDRDLEYETKVQLQPHIVYISYTGDYKVGVTRKPQVPYRWIDQGAVMAFPILETPNRHFAGLAEVALKEIMKDKTSYRKMLLQNNFEDELDINYWKEKIKKALPNDLHQYILEDSQHSFFQYPRTQDFEKIGKSLKLKIGEEYSGKLIGIKGQYWIFEDQTIFNVRSHEGFYIHLNIL